MKMTNPALNDATRVLALCVLLVASAKSYAQLVHNTAELTDAIENAIPGTTITLSDGRWDDVFIDLDKDGEVDNRITITAQSPGAVIMTGNSRVYLEGSYLTVSGLVFRDADNLVTSSSTIEPVIELKRCDYCQVLNNLIDGYNGTEAQKELTFKWILTDGQYNEIAYNSFIGKYGVGSIINDNRNSSEPDYLSIHHNYFADRTPINEVNEDNDQDAIRIGNSGTSLNDSYTEVYSNYFENFFGEIEVISNKSGSNKYYNNTFRNYSGTLTLRHGNNCEVYGNYFFAEDNVYSGGVRVIGEGHKVYNNYIEGVNSRKPNGSTSNATGGINVSNGRLNSALNGYYQVIDAVIVHNTLVNCDYGLRIGTTVSSDLDQAPKDIVVANNIMYNITEEDYQIRTNPIGNSISEGNMEDLALSALESDDGLYRLTSGAEPIDAGLGSYDFLSLDALGGMRDAIPDAGSEEYGANGMNYPFDDLDIGITLGFGAISEPTLSSNPTVITFGKYKETMGFKVISNVDWFITEDIPWLELDPSSGTGTMDIMAMTDANETGEDREGTITIRQQAGADDLSAEILVIQTNSFIPGEIDIVGSSSKGAQDKEGIEEENAYDDDLSTYWTGNPDTAAEVSITLDLDCRHVLTEIGINFWKADERTTTFSIAIGDDAEGPFMTILDNVSSASDGVTVDTEQLFDLENVVARYVKFIGIGNSSSTNWTSVANINIYGDAQCEPITNVINYPLIEDQVNVYPIPAQQAFINVSAESEISAIEIFGIDGLPVLEYYVNPAKNHRLNIQDLASGTYFIRVNNTRVYPLIVLR